MPLTPNTRLGPYVIEAPIGAGGMGEVYRARDTRLDRTVAVKVLPPAVADDPIVRERFEREARSLSALSHPNICTVYDVGRQGDIDYLVMEYLEGRTLAAVLEQGALPPADAVSIASEIADALWRAHRHGIVHRDLKPANVMILRGHGTARATPKLLDFGLAKQAPAAGMPGATTVADATRSSPLTGSGTLVGTIQYMAPEQVEGREADARTDVWGFGCVLYEMLTGRRAFDAATSASLIASILDRQPAPIDLPQAALAPGLSRLIAVCLEKNPDDRFQSMRDVRRELEWLRQTPATPPRDLPPASRRGTILAASALLVMALTGAAALWSVIQRRPQALPPTFFGVELGSPGYRVGAASFFGGAGSGTPGVSPDGTRIAFVAHNSTDAGIWLRDLSKLDAVRLPGSNGARGLFWSPDGKSIGFFAGGKLKIMDIASERVENLCDAPAAFGGTWAADGTILFSPDERSPIYKVSAQGGTPVAVTSLAAGRQVAHRWPQFLPDGRHFLFMPWEDGVTTRAITVGSLDGSPPKALFEAQSAAVLAGDYLLYVQDQPARLVAWGFDAATLQLRGKPFSLVPDENVDYQWYTGEPNASAGGATLAYTTGKYRKSQLTWIGRSGRTLDTVGEVAVQFDPTLSPDGTQLALERHNAERQTGDIWTVDLARSAFSRLTSAPGYETTPTWSPDGRRVAYASDQGPSPKIYVNTASGSGTETLLVDTPVRAFPLDWSPDGRYLVYMLHGGATRNDIWTYDVERRAAAPLLTSAFNEGWARVSPNGRWIAYVSDESQRGEIYVRSFPDGALKTQISTAGGHVPQWRRDGAELFYLAPDNTMMAVDVRTSGDRLEASRPQGLFVANVDQNKSIRNQYSASPDGQKFLILSLAERNASPIVAVLNWHALLQRNR